MVKSYNLYMNKTFLKEILVQKASGEMEPFSEQKLRRSLRKSGASKNLVEMIVVHIRRELKSGMKTSDIYRHAFSLLRRQELSVAGRYSLKQGIIDLGPSGHPFETLVGELFKAEGFSAKVGQIIKGLCVNHEVDVVAKKGSQRIMAECKFHNQFGLKSDVKVALYIKARFDDIKAAGQKLDEARLVTNTKLTQDAIRYARCVGMKVLGWNYPVKEGLGARIDRAGLHPITCLTSLSRAQKRQLLDRGLVLCKDLIKRQDLLLVSGMTKIKIDTLKVEVNRLCRF